MPSQSLNPLTVKHILDKFGRDNRTESINLPLLTFKDLYAKLTDEEIDTLEILLSFNPLHLGFKGKYLTMDDPPNDLARLSGQSFIRNSKTYTIKDQFLPQEACQSFKRLSSAISRELGSSLLVESGYRSPAHQAITFLTYLELANFDIFYVASGVALPGYSQHGDPQYPAVDVINQDGIPTDQQPELFAHTTEFNWLMENASKYGFYLSYPKDNSEGVKFEPWHWRYCG